jgi:hypothetical protein
MLLRRFLCPGRKGSDRVVTGTADAPPNTPHKINTAHRTPPSTLVTPPATGDQDRAHTKSAKVECAAAQSMEKVSQLRRCKSGIAHRSVPRSSARRKVRSPVMKSGLVNLLKRDIDQLRDLVKQRLRRIQHQPVLLAGPLAKTGLDPQPPQLLHRELF